MAQLYHSLTWSQMNIKNIPGSLIDLEKFVAAYENKKVVFAETNNAVGNATINIVKGWMPFFARPFVLPVMQCLLDKTILNAVGYTAPPSLLRAVVLGAMRMRAVFLRTITFKKYPSFFTNEKNRTYKHGYEINQLGPENLVKKM